MRASTQRNGPCRLATGMVGNSAIPSPLKLSAGITRPMTGRGWGADRTNLIWERKPRSQGHEEDQKMGLLISSHAGEDSRSHGEGAPRKPPVVQLTLCGLPAGPYLPRNENPGRGQERGPGEGASGFPVCPAHRVPCRKHCHHLCAGTHRAPQNTSC